MTASRQLDFRTAGFDATVLALAFLYIWLRVEPELEYSASAPMFRLTWGFFQQFADRPGGLLDYSSAFVAQFNYRNWLGAAVFTGLLALVLLQGRLLLGRLTGRHPGLVPWVPVWLLLLARQRFDTQALGLGISLAVSLALALGYAAWSPRWPAARIATCGVAAAALFYAGGLWSGALFVALSVASELSLHRAWRHRLACGVAGLMAPMAWWLGLPELEWDRVLNPWGRGAPLAVAASLYLFFPLAAGLLRLLQRVRPPAQAPETVRPPRPAPRSTAQAGQAAGWLRRPTVKRAVQVGFWVAASALVWAGFNQPRQALRTIEYCAARNQHERLLTVASRLQLLDPASSVRLHRALFHTGRLLEELFGFSNQRVWALFPELRHGPEACRPQSQTLLELGQVNLAEHFAYEALEVEGERPDLLRMLAAINVLKNQPQAARVFLHALRQVPFHRAWAQAWLTRLETDPRLEEEPELRLIRSRMVNTDFPHNEMAVASFCRQLLQANPTNQMAFEYLMAQYLLDRQLDGLVKELPRLEAFQYKALPRHLQEALVLYEHLHGGPAVDLGNRPIAPEIRQRFQRFSEAVGQPAHQTPDGQRRLAQQFGDTYWHYYFFRKQAAPQGPAPRSTESS